MPRNGKKVRAAVRRAATKITRGRRAKSTWGLYNQVERGIGAGRIIQKATQVAGLEAQYPMITGGAAIGVAALRGKIPGAVGALLVDTEYLDRIWSGVRGGFGGGNGGGAI